MALSPSNHGKDIQDFIEKSTPAVASLMQFCKNLSVL